MTPLAVMELGFDVGVQVANQEARLRSLHLPAPIAGNLQNPAYSRPPVLQIFDSGDVDAPVVYPDLEVPGFPNALRVRVVRRQIQMRRAGRNLQLLDVDVLRPINGAGAQVIEGFVVNYGVREIHIHLALRVIESPAQMRGPGKIPFDSNVRPLDEREHAFDWQPAELRLNAGRVTWGELRAPRKFDVRSSKIRGDIVTDGVSRGPRVRRQIAVVLTIRLLVHAPSPRR